MRYLIPIYLLALVVFHYLERRSPIHSHYQTGPKRRGYLADVIAAVVNGPALSGLTKLAMFWLIVRIPYQAQVLRDWTFLAQFGLYFLVNDFVRYWLHRLYHASDFFWRFHRVHHTVVEMDSLSLLRIHVGEAIIKNGLIAVPFWLLGVDRSVILLYTSLDVVKGFWHHANLRTTIGPFNYLFNSAELHWWHHSTESRGHRSNYGSILSLWDWIFGTAYWPRGEWPETIGVKGMKDFPDTYLAQFLSVFYTDEELIQGTLQKPHAARNPALPLASPLMAASLAVAAGAEPMVGQEPPPPSAVAHEASDSDKAH